MDKVWEPHWEYGEDEIKVPANPVSAVFQAIGAATRPDIWGPDGVFDDQRATAIANGLITHLLKYPL